MDKKVKSEMDECIKFAKTLNNKVFEFWINSYAYSDSLNKSNTKKDE